jgi:hypothetical protein
MAAVGQKLERADVIDMLWLIRWVTAQLRDVQRRLYHRAN